MNGGDPLAIPKHHYKKRNPSSMLATHSKYVHKHK